MFSRARALRKAGVLAINERNAQYILRYNPRRLYPLVDDKLRTKQLALNSGITVPDLYGVVEVEGQVRSLPRLLAKHEEFVFKPARGTGGSGILVAAHAPHDRYRKADGTLMDQDELSHHVFSILSGLYSLGGQPDSALIEYRVHFDPVFKAISYQGVPDIRIIVFLGVPVMAMVRLPTKESDGKANLHQGAIGVGIDVATGTTLSAVWRNDVITEHPDTGSPVTGVSVPQWETLLEIAARCYELTGLGYQGVDIVLDRERGPMLLELNARPGLNIQLANGCGLLPRLELVEREHSTLESVADRVTFAREHFRAEACVS